MRWILSVASGLALALPAAANAQQAAGQVIWFSGDVAAITPDKVVKPLAKGDAVHQGDLIRTGPDSYAQILMRDQGLIALRPDSSLRLVTYGPDRGGDRVVMNLVKGGFRSVTGMIGREDKSDYRLNTRTASIGIRGTDHETFITPDGATYNRVTLGGTYLQSAQGRVEIAPGKAALASLQAAPSLLPRTPEFMHLTKVAVPAGAPFNAGVVAHGKRRLPEHVTMPVLPAQALGDNARAKGWGKGGKCGGPCNPEALAGKGVTKGVGKAR